ncbi:hypothetical protein K1T71_006524 [Dendrolimus kikuchii]|uniref:Uncharacterized protein n=1 Tax=Dendrolimus kikuchii TaxID=765133 RepID=A0ACC1D1D5_9NEOP|nr:hypothetical protein K1T71_006524 [Dendrolimus kikuchii]
MDKSKVIRSSATSTATKIFTLLLIVCLVECVTEQRINSRGSKASNIIEKVNGWRSQRGGSCLSYGHSCWGAHGKRSDKAPASAPDWYLTRILRRMATNNEVNQGKRLAEDNNDISAIYQVDVADNAPATDRLNNIEEGPVQLPFNRNPDAKPMLNDDVLSKMKIWQIMRESSEDK